METHEELLTVQDIVKNLRVSKDTVYNWINKAGLPVIRIGRVIRIRKVELDKWIEEQSSQDTAERSG